jgi:hypothetical protein
MIKSFALLKRPSAWLPLAMSLGAFTFLMLYIALFGLNTPLPQDEGGAARFFQLLMLAQVPVGLWFAARWLPRAPRQALPVLSLQAVAWLGVFATIWTLEH